MDNFKTKIILDLSQAIPGSVLIHDVSPGLLLV